MRRRRLVSIASLLAAAALALPLVGANATSQFTFTGNGAGRFAGANRFDTARLIAKSAGFGQVDNVILATGRNFPDALAGNYLAGAFTSPILLTERDSLPIETATALQETVKPKTVTLLGGPAAISDSVANDLRGRGYSVDRVQGNDRYGTALAVARKGLSLAGIGTTGGKKTAFLATGQGFADALAAGPVAWNKHLPILLTESGTLSPEAKQGLTDVGAERIVILGGTAAVSSTVETSVKTSFPSATVDRLAGGDRTGTAVRIAQWALDPSNASFGSDHVNLARGDDFADALAGGPHGGIEAGPILLAASPTALDTATGSNTAYLNLHESTLETGHIFGGTGAVSDAVAQAAAEAAGQAPPEAADGTSTPVVKKVVAAEDYFVSTADKTYYYDAGDTYKYKGQPMGSMANFEKALSVGDSLSVTYASNGVSTFDLTGDTAATTSKPSGTVANTAKTSIEVSATLPATGVNSSATTYRLERAKYDLGCQSLAPLTFTTVTASFDGDYTDTNGGAGLDSTACYVYRVVTVQPAPTQDNSTNVFTANSANSNNVNLSATPPTFTATTTTDTDGIVNGGDVHTFVFSAVMNNSVAADGSSYRLSDGDGSVADVICGPTTSATANATCSYSITNGGNQPVTQLTVTLRSTPKVVSGTANGVSYPAQIIAVSDGWVDGSGTKVTFAGSDRTLEKK